MQRASMQRAHTQGAPPAGTALAPSAPVPGSLPAIAPLLPPVYAVDLMTQEGSALFGAQ